MTLWKSISGFSFHYFEPLEDAPELIPFAQLISVWRSKFDGDRIPKWSDFDFVDFRGWHSRIAIFDISYDPFDYKARLTGEEYNRVVGRNVMGMTRDGLMQISIEDEVAEELHEKASRQMLITYTKGVNIINRQNIDVEFLELPLSDNGLYSTHTIEALVSKVIQTTLPRRDASPVNFDSRNNAFPKRTN